MNDFQLTLIQAGEFIPCEDVAYFPAKETAPPSPEPPRRGAVKLEPDILPPYITATTALPINTTRPVSVRLDNEIIPVPFIRAAERKAVSCRIRIDGPVAVRIARAMGLL